MPEKEIDENEEIEVVIEDDEENAEEEIEEEIENDEEEAIEEAIEEEKEEDKKEDKKEPPQGKRGSAKKRITQLVKKTHDLERRLEELMAKDASRSQKENDEDLDKKYSYIVEQRQKAMDEGDSKKLTEFDLQLMSLAQSNPSILNNASSGNKFDIEGYFQQKNSWYNKDSKKTLAARSIHQDVQGDSYWAKRPIEDQLDEVAKRTNELFRNNPYKKSSPSEGVSSARPTKTITVTKSQLKFMDLSYPNLSRQERIKKLREYNERTAKAGREVSYGI